MNKIMAFLLSIVTLFTQTINLKAFSAATVPLNVTVNGSLLITNAFNDGISGKDPTLNVGINVTPDLGQVETTNFASFRIRTNKAAWRLTAQRTAISGMGTGLTENDISLSVAKFAGAKGDPNAGNLVAPFDKKTTLKSVPTSGTVDVISGIKKIAKEKDPNNQQNYMQVITTYGVYPDFFFEEGTFSTTITYNLVAP